MVHTRPAHSLHKVTRLKSEDTFLYTVLTSELAFFFFLFPTRTHPPEILLVPTHHVLEQVYNSTVITPERGTTQLFQRHDVCKFISIQTI